MKLIPAKMEHVFATHELVQETIKEIYFVNHAPELYKKYHLVKEL